MYMYVYSSPRADGVGEPEGDEEAGKQGRGGAVGEGERGLRAGHPDKVVTEEGKTNREIAAHFDGAEADGDGTLSLAELKVAFGDELDDAFFATMDANEDGWSRCPSSRRATSALRASSRRGAKGARCSCYSCAGGAGGAGAADPPLTGAVRHDGTTDLREHLHLRRLGHRLALPAKATEYVATWPLLLWLAAGLLAGIAADFARWKLLITALMAAAGGHAVVVSLLLQAGAEVDAADEIGATALIHAGESDFVVCARALLAADNDGGTALMVRRRPWLAASACCRPACDLLADCCLL